MSDIRIESVMAVEKVRCEALVDQDFDRLRTVISRDLTHTHTGGNTENYDHYFALLQGPMRYLDIKRREVEVSLYGNIAVMSGIALVTGRLGDGEPMIIETKVLQVWVETNDAWQMVAFQGTKIV